MNTRHLPGRKTIVGESTFRFVLEMEVEKAVRLGYCVSILCLSPDGTGDTLDVSRQLARVSAARLRGTDVIALLADGSVGILLLDADLNALPAILARATDQIEDGAPLVVRGERHSSVSGGAACYPATASTGAAALAQARHLRARATREGGGRLVLPGEPGGGAGGVDTEFPFEVPRRGRRSSASGATPMSHLWRRALRALPPPGAVLD